MPRNYNLSHPSIAGLLLFSLQSCSNFSNPIIPGENSPINNIRELTHQIAIKHLVDKELIAEGGYLVTFYEQDSKLQADVRVDEKQKDPNYKSLPVIIARGIDLVQLPHVNTESQKRIIHFNTPKNGQTGNVSLTRHGLLGGMIRDDEDEEKDTPKEFFCPITKKIMIDPVIAVDGYTYESSAIQAWFGKGKRTSPVTNNILPNIILKPNYTLHSLICGLKERILREEKEKNARENNNLGVMYLDSEEIKKVYKRPIEWYKKAANRGLAEAQNNLGAMYQYGHGIERDPKKAKEWIKKAAKQGLAPAQNNLGIIYLDGKGIEKDLKKAREWYKKSADQGFAEAQNSLGFMYLDGKGVEKDPKEAKEWFEKAANQGNTEAQNTLGVMYLTGKGVEEDPKKAREWFEKSAKQGFAPAQNNLGVMYINDEVVKKDFKKAREWFEKSVKQGYPRAQNNLGIMYQYGYGVEKDAKKGIELLKKAASQGFAEAQKTIDTILPQLPPNLKRDRQEEGQKEKQQLENQKKIVRKY